MKNIKTGNTLIIVLLMMITSYLYFGGVDKIKEIRTADLVKELSEVKKELKDRDSTRIKFVGLMYDQNKKNRDSLLRVRKHEKILEDSINKLHVSYMNGSYLKEQHDSTNTTYWYLNFSYESKDGQNFYANKIWKFENGFSFAEYTERMEKKYEIDQYKHRIDLKFYHQVSERDYFKWKNQK